MTLLDDSVQLAIQSTAQPHSDIGNTYSRASLLSTTLFIEACANTCLDLLALEGQFAADVDRLPIVSKFEVVARVAFPKRPFRRSRHEVQYLNELKVVRDCFVHPKGQRIIWESWSPDKGSSKSPRTKALDLPRIASYTFSDDAIAALKGAHSFLRHFFRDICKFGPYRVSALLMSEDVVPNPRERTYPLWPRSTHRWLKEHKIDLSYMQIGKL